VKDLGEQLMQDSATLSPLLKRLEARGYLTRERDPHNERALAVTLTEEGARLQDGAQAVQPEMMRRLRLSPQQVRLLNRGMQRLIDNTQDAESA
ncbi:MarR family transcriptional regulator, partial [Streptomyces sp. tea 10]|nr:MarR family transcriptional regulator [Streptomyces sp. tea 10]